MGSGSSGEDGSHGSAEWQDTTWEEHPYMVRLSISKHDGKSSICGGSILTTHGNGGKGVILTAAHCLSNAKSVKTYVGETETYSGGTWYGATSYLNHYAYKGASDDWKNDIALIFLNAGIDHRGASAIQLHSSIGVVSDGEAIRLLGYYGSRDSDACTGCSDTNTLEYMWGHFVPNSECRNTWGDGVSGNEVMCIDDEDPSDGTSATCGGDSGSPAVFEGRQIGLVSYGEQYCDPTLPSVFASVPNYVSWIRSNCPDCLNYASTYTSQSYGCGGVSTWFTGCGDTSYSIAARSGEYITQLCIWHGAEIDAIQAKFSDYTWSSKAGGGGGGMTCYNAGSKCFTSVTVKSDSRIKSLQFRLSDGTQTSKYGGDSGRGPYHDNSEVFGYCLSGINMEAKNTVHEIQFVWSKVDMDDVTQAYEILEDDTGNGNEAVIIAICAIIVGVIACIGCIGFMLFRRRKKRIVQTFEDMEDIEEEVNEENNNEEEEEIEVDVEIELQETDTK